MLILFYFIYIIIFRIRLDDAYGKVLPGRLSSEERSGLIQKLIERAYVPRPKNVARGTSKSKK